MYTIHYAKLISMVQPFFIQRGYPDLASNDSIMMYINMAIQDIFNKDNFTFLYEREELNTFTTDNKFNYFTTKHGIRKVKWCTSGNGDMIPTLGFIDSIEKYNIKHGENIIITTTSVTSIEVVYIKSYEWIEYSDAINMQSGSQKLVPLPHSFIPPLVKSIYDWASPINLMQSEAAQYDFYSHAQARLNELKADDSLTDDLRLSL